MNSPISQRFAACSTHLIQYQAPIWRRLAGHPSFSFEAFLGTDMSVRGYKDSGFGVEVTWDSHLTSGFAHTFLSTDPGIHAVGSSLRARGLLKHFRRFQPHVVLLTAYSGRFHLDVLRAAKAVGAKVIMRHEASDVAVTRSRLKEMVRDLLLRRLYARIDGFAVIGIEARRHLLRLGVPPSRMSFSPYCVDSDFFAGEVVRWLPERAILRSALGIGSDDFALVFSGKLIPKKDPLLIPSAIASLSEDRRARIHLIVAGDGVLRPALTEACRGILGDHFHMLGFLNQTEIGRAYAAGDLLALPSRRGAGETWGLVVNEAMQFGLGALVSDGVGCGPDLIESGVTGQIFPSGRIERLADVIHWGTSLSHRERESIRSKSMQRAARYSAANATEGLAALAMAMTKPDSEI